MKLLTDKINEIIEVGYICDSAESYFSWSNRVSSLLRTGVGKETADEFSSLGTNSRFAWEESLPNQIGFLEGYQLKAELNSTALLENTDNEQPIRKLDINKTKKVFIVHGHDTEAKESVARYLEKLDLKPIILHEQPNGGRTIIEKFEVFSDVGFAVILLTPDDLGSSKDEAKQLKKRARQNVILELGYFVGKLGRKRVCALYKSGVEMPSDYQGVIYTEIDTAGAWRTKLAQELVEAGFSINLHAILGN